MDHFLRDANHVFVHLHCHSHYSFLRGVGSPEEIVAAAVEQKMPAVALTDTNGMYGAVAFYKTAIGAGVKPIVGVTLEVQWPRPGRGKRVASTKSGQAIRRNGESNDVAIPVVLLAMDLEGYSNLCQLVTLRHLGTTKLGEKKDGEEEEGRAVFIDELAEHNKGVIAICPLPGRATEASGGKGTMNRGPAKEKSDGEEAVEWIAGLKEIFGERLWIEVQHLSAGEGRKLREAERVGRELGVPLVATNNVHFLRAEEHLHHRAVNAIRTGGLLTTVAPPEITTGEAWFKSAEEMRRVFPDHPELLQATV